jgi:radial spoke head protein 4A
LSCVLSKVLDERPENAADIIEDISKDVKRSKFVSKVDTVQDKVDKSTEVALAEIHNKLFSVSLCINVMYDQLLMVY